MRLRDADDPALDGGAMGEAREPSLTPPPTDGDWDGKGGMHRISTLIAWMQGVQKQIGDTCVFAPKMSWGGLALNQHADFQKLPSRAALIDELQRWKGIDADLAGYVADGLLLRFPVLEAALPPAEPPSSLRKQIEALVIRQTSADNETEGERAYNEALVDVLAVLDSGAEREGRGADTE